MKYGASRARKENLIKNRESQGDTPAYPRASLCEEAGSVCVIRTVRGVAGGDVSHLMVALSSRPSSSTAAIWGMRANEWSIRDDPSHTSKKPIYPECHCSNRVMIGSYQIQKWLYPSPVFPQIAGLLGGAKRKTIVNIHASKHEQKHEEFLMGDKWTVIGSFRCTSYTIRRSWAAVQSQIANIDRQRRIAKQNDWRRYTSFDWSIKSKLIRLKAPGHRRHLHIAVLSCCGGLHAYF